MRAAGGGGGGGGSTFASTTGGGGAGVMRILGLHAAVIINVAVNTANAKNLALRGIFTLPPG